MSSLPGAATGYIRYRGNVGQLSFLLHRITGLGTLLFLGFHILDTASVQFAPALYGQVIDVYRTTLFSLAEMVLVFCVIFHGINGLRIAGYDMLGPRWWTIPSARVSARWTLALAIVLWLPAAYWMLRGLLAFNYGLNVP
jgi:succinate dehydrogenase / fumarate reductase, cytochrome b subunit